MRLHRFYIDKPLGEEIVVESAGSEKGVFHQMTNVFRFTSGDEVFLFSSHTKGTDFRYRITTVSKQSITFEPVSSSPNILPSVSLTLVMALVKKDTFETVVRQATELGVTRIIPVTASRSEKKNLNFERLSLIAQEATEQSGRGAIPTISSLSTFKEALSLTQDEASIIGSLHGISLTELRNNGFSKQNIALWVGPEGGWTEDEEKMAEECGFLSYKLTDTVLKADTAAVALLSTLLA